MRLWRGRESGHNVRFCPHLFSFHTPKERLFGIIRMPMDAIHQMLIPYETFRVEDNHLHLIPLLAVACLQMLAARFWIFCFWWQNKNGKTALGKAKTNDAQSQRHSCDRDSLWRRLAPDAGYASTKGKNRLKNPAENKMPKISNRSDAVGRAIGIWILTGICVYMLFVPGKRTVALIILAAFWIPIVLFSLFVKNK